MTNSDKILTFLRAPVCFQADLSSSLHLTESATRPCVYSRVKSTFTMQVKWSRRETEDHYFIGIWTVCTQDNFPYIYIYTYAFSCRCNWFLFNTCYIYIIYIQHFLHIIYSTLFTHTYITLFIHTHIYIYTYAFSCRCNWFLFNTCYKIIMWYYILLPNRSGIMKANFLYSFTYYADERHLAYWKVCSVLEDLSTNATQPQNSCVILENHLLDIMCLETMTGSLRA